jgi:hypothetical protein
MVWIPLHKLSEFQLFSLSYLRSRSCKISRVWAGSNSHRATSLKPRWLSLHRLDSASLGPAYYYLNESISIFLLILSFPRLFFLCFDLFFICLTQGLIKFHYLSKLSHFPHLSFWIWSWWLSSTVCFSAQFR